MPGNCGYQKAWEKDYPWLSCVKTDKKLAHCGICPKSFRIDNSGIGQVKSHVKCHESEKKKKEVLNWQNQKKFEAPEDGMAIKLTTNKSMVLSEKDAIMKAEIIQALHMVEKNISFASAKDDNERFLLQFPDSLIAKGYRQSDSKVQYVIKFGIADYVKKKLINDAKDTPYSFLFDETTTSQVKKQYDAYLLYWSKRSGNIVHAYCGSLFVGHCTAEDLVEHYGEFVKQLGLDSNYLLHFGMDGPNTNLSFENKLTQQLAEVNTSFLKIGSCSLHPVHGAFQKGIKQLYEGVIPVVTTESNKDSNKQKGTFDIDDFFTDIHFFFKLSSARREDYATLEAITGVAAEYAKKHAETRWVSMKYVAVRCLEQWENLKEYFLKFLPRQSNFKHDVEKTQRYVRLKTSLSDPTMEAYVGFVAFVAQDFEAFLVPFQSKEPMIHHLYPAMLSLLYELQRKFIRKSKLNAEDLSQNFTIDVNKEKNVKPLNLIDVGSKAKTMFSQNTLIPDEAQEKFRKNCLKFYQTAVTKLQNKLPLDVNLLKYAQYINPVKRNAAGATSAISNLALNMTTVLENVLENVFKMEAPTKDEVVDKIRSQWHFFQNEELKEEWYMKGSDDDDKPSSRQQESYWARAQVECGLNATPSPLPSSQFKRIDEFWRRVGNIVDEFGAKKYAQLVALVQCVLSLSHGNSTPERGFSINKLLLAVHGYSTYEDTIIALRMVKDELARVGGTCKFPITREFLDSVKDSWSKYDADRLARQQAEEAQKKKRKQDEEEKSKQLQTDKKISGIDDEIENCKSNISVANDLIDSAQESIKKALDAKNPSTTKQLTQQGLSKLQVGTERKRKFEDDLEKLIKKKKLLKK